MQDIQIYTNLQDQLMLTSPRDGYGRVQEAVCTGDPKDAAGDPELRVSHAGPHQEAKGSGWKPGGDVPGEGEDRCSSGDTEASLPSSFPFYSTLVTSLVVGATHTQSGLLSSVNPFPTAELC